MTGIFLREAGVFAFILDFILVATLLAIDVARGCVVPYRL